MAVLRSDNLRVPSEMHVFRSVVSWLEADKSRLQQVGLLLCSLKSGKQPPGIHVPGGLNLRDSAACWVSTASSATVRGGGPGGNTCCTANGRELVLAMCPTATLPRLWCMVEGAVHLCGQQDSLCSLHIRQAMGGVGKKWAEGAAISPRNHHQTEL